MGDHTLLLPLLWVFNKSSKTSEIGGRDHTQKGYQEEALGPSTKLRCSESGNGGIGVFARFLQDAASFNTSSIGIDPGTEVLGLIPRFLGDATSFKPESLSNHRVCNQVGHGFFQPSCCRI